MSDEALADRIADTLAAGPPRTVPELARQLRVRDEAVREGLRADPRFEQRPAPAERSARARLWALVPAVGRVGRVAEREERPTEPPPPSGASAALWRFSLPAGPRSVGEAIRRAA